MKVHVWLVSGIVFGALGLAIASVPAQAKNKTVKACEAEWKAAEAAKTTGGKKRAEFITACRQEQAPAATAAPAPAPAATEPAPAPKPAAKKKEAPMAAPAATGNAVFPSTVSPKYSKESAGKARMHTCLDQYNENKANNGNGGLKWIQKGGGYYSECNKRLKGA
jgi:membrane protein involved in colicin uptake